MKRHWLKSTIQTNRDNLRRGIFISSTKNANMLIRYSPNLECLRSEWMNYSCHLTWTFLCPTSVQFEFICCSCSLIFKCNPSNPVPFTHPSIRFINCINKIPSKMSNWVALWMPQPRNTFKRKENLSIVHQKSLLKIYNVSRHKTQWANLITIILLGALLDFG